MRIHAFVFASIVACVPAHGSRPEGRHEERVAAFVNGRPIFTRELDEAVAHANPHPATRERATSLLLLRLVEDELFIQEAIRRGIGVTDVEVENRRALRVRSNWPGDSPATSAVYRDDLALLTERVLERASAWPPSLSEAELHESLKEWAFTALPRVELVEIEVKDISSDALAAAFSVANRIRASAPEEGAFCEAARSEGALCNKFDRWNWKTTAIMLAHELQWLEPGGTTPPFVSTLQTPPRVAVVRLISAKRSLRHHLYARTLRALPSYESVRAGYAACLRARAVVALASEYAHALSIPDAPKCRSVPVDQISEDRLLLQASGHTGQSSQVQPEEIDRRARQLARLARFGNVEELDEHLSRSGITSTAFRKGIANSLAVEQAAAAVVPHDQVNGGDQWITYFWKTFESQNRSRLDVAFFSESKYLNGRSSALRHMDRVRAGGVFCDFEGDGSCISKPLPELFGIAWALEDGAGRGARDELLGPLRTRNGFVVLRTQPAPPAFVESVDAADAIANLTMPLSTRRRWIDWMRYRRSMTE